MKSCMYKTVNCRSVTENVVSYLCFSMSTLTVVVYVFLLFKEIKKEVPNKFFQYHLTCII